VSLKLIDNTCSIEVLLNGKQQLFLYNSVQIVKLVFDRVMNLENWDALAAVASINKACEKMASVKHGVK
jgi:hypothetical protein